MKLDDPAKALEYLETAKMPIVLKVDGLALGKGVLICNILEEAKASVKSIMEDKQFVWYLHLMDIRWLMKKDS